MTVLYYDCFSGISGDMNLGALIDLGVDEAHLIDELSKLNIDSEYEIKIKKGMKRGITGTKVDVILINKDHPHSQDHKLNHEYLDCHLEPDSNNDHYSHIHEHARNLQNIENIILSSSLNDYVKKLSIDMFMLVAEAEGRVHGKDLYEVHFHEVGAVDSIVDIVGAAICLDYLKVDKVMASSVQVGGGMVKCAHGLIPVPAPATVELLKGIPIKTGMVPFETTTPTGAAILAANVSEFTDEMEFTIEKIGYGLGTKDFEIPNVLRVYLGKEYNKEEIDRQFIIETNIDDMNPEIYEYLEEKLFAQGALDVFKTAIMMKKGRPAIKLSVLATEDKAKEIEEMIFRETSSFGIRKYAVEKDMLHREFEKVDTKYGQVSIKKAYYQGEFIKYKPEYEECKTLARENNVAIDKIYKEVYRVVEDGMDDYK